MSIDLGAVPVTGFISPTDNEDTYATHKAEFGKGGYRSVANIEERDIIAEDRRELGMLVYVISDNRMYQLIDGIENINWVISDSLPLLPEDYIFKGNSFGIAEASPALIDVNLEIITINEQIADLIEGAAAETILEGAVTGNGVGTIITTLTDIDTSQITDFDAAVTSKRLDEFATPTSPISMGSQRINLVATPSANADAANKSYVDGKRWTTSEITDFNSAVTAYRLDQFAAPNTSLSMGGQKIINVATATLTTDAANKSYVDNKTWIASQITDFNTAVRTNRLNQMTNPNGSVNMTNQLISNLRNPLANNDAANKLYVDNKTVTLTGAVTGTGVLGTIATTLTNINTSQITDFDTAVRTNRLDQLATPTAAVSMGSQNITNLATPTTSTHATNKSYVDGKITNSFGSSFIYSINNSTVNVLTANVAQKINGTTTSEIIHSFGFGAGDNNVVYTGTTGDFYYVFGQVEVSSSITNLNLNLELVKNGSTLPPTPLFAKRFATTDPDILTIYTAPFLLTNGDYLELYIKSTVTTTVTVSNMLWAAMLVYSA